MKQLKELNIEVIKRQMLKLETKVDSKCNEKAFNTAILDVNKEQIDLRKLLQKVEAEFQSFEGNTNRSMSFLEKRYDERTVIMNAFSEDLESFKDKLKTLLQRSAARASKERAYGSQAPEEIFNIGNNDMLKDTEEKIITLQKDFGRLDRQFDKLSGAVNKHSWQKADKEALKKQEGNF